MACPSRTSEALVSVASLSGLCQLQMCKLSLHGQRATWVSSFILSQLHAHWRSIGGIYLCAASPEMPAGRR